MTFQNKELEAKEKRLFFQQDGELMFFWDVDDTEDAMERLLLSFVHEIGDAGAQPVFARIWSALKRGFLFP